MSLPSQPRTYDSILNDLIARVRTLEAMPRQTVFPVYAAWSGSATVSTGTEAFVPVNNLQANDVTVFGSGDSRTLPPTNTSGDDLLLLLKPGIFMWTVSFTTNLASTWPAESYPYVNWRVETPGADTFYHSWSSPNQSGFSGTWTVPSSGPNSPPIFIASGSVGASVSWLNRARITYHGFGAIPTSYLPGPLWGSLACKYVNNSGSDSTIRYDAFMQAIVTDDNMPDLTTII